MKGGTPSDILLRELVEEGNLMRIGTGGTTYGSAGTELDYWLTTQDMTVRWEGERVPQVAEIQAAA